MASKFLLFVGDDEKELFDFTDKDERVEIGMNPEKSPSVAILVECADRLAQSTVDRARKQGIKVGPYASLDKGVEWLRKVLDLQP